ncbi:MAG TPA: hypothetical protein VER55_14400 [Ardenticatenaceae bacterium]|nr:hypothetical protein [Ardenticatenaceae bacterium]
MARVVPLLLLVVVLALNLAPTVLLAAPDQAGIRAAPAPQQSETDGQVGRESWEGTNWGLVSALFYTALIVVTGLTILGVILSWPHRRR